ncbi:MAG: oligosaccharide flippase family protein [Patescibacteria group bacterium]
MGFIKRLIGHELVSGSFYLFLGSIFANILAFLLNLFLARNLSYIDYGIFASLLSVITLAYIPAGSINTIIVKFATKYYSQNEMDKVSSFYFLSGKFIFILALFLFFLFLTLAFPLNIFLHLNNVWYGIIVALVISIYYLNSLNVAFLQSLLKFSFISFINTFGGVIKLVVGIVLVYAGFNAFSGLWAIFFMTVGSFLVAFIPLRTIIAQKNVKKINIPTKEIMSYSIPAFFTILFLTSFTAMDVILVKHFFSSHDAGFYAGLSLMGKVIFYFTFPIPMVMFPLLIKRHTLGLAYKKLFYLALLLVFLPGMLITGFYYLFPQITINLFLGGRDYLMLSKYLGVFGLYLTIFSLVNVCVNFFLSFNETKISYFVIIAAVLQIVLISIFHADFYQVIYVSLATVSLLLITLLTYYFKKFNL